MDTVYPEPLSRLHRRAIPKKIHKKNAARYRTQPITFAEIQEVDEETINDEIQEKMAAGSSKSELDLKAKLEEFKRQRDRDLCEGRLSSWGTGNENGTESGGSDKSGNKGNSIGMENLHEHSNPAGSRTTCSRTSV